MDKTLSEKEVDPKKPKNKGGHPTKYNKELAELICERVATHDVGYNTLYEMYDDMPHRVTVNIWRRKYPEFRSMYAQAKCEQLEFLAEEILEIADDARNDWMEHHDRNTGESSWKLNGEHVQRSRLRIDTRKWLACKLVPRVYGDSNNNNSNPSDTFNKIRELVNSFNETNKSDV